MRILVTAGNTQVPIDQVRCITNIFTGRTGTRIAVEAYNRGHRVCLLTSQPERVPEIAGSKPPAGSTWSVISYQTFNNLQNLMGKTVRGGGFDAVIHSAAVSDYVVDGIYAPAADTTFDASHRRWLSTKPKPRLLDATADKVKSFHPELWFRLVPTPKLVDLVRQRWGFRGILVKFKLEVGVDDKKLLDIAEQSRLHSEADLMVANTLDGMHSWAYLGPLDGKYKRTERSKLAARLLAAIEELHRERVGD